MAISVWDDEYAISVPAKLQTTKEDISEILKGFQREPGTKGYEIYKVRGWDYVDLCETYERAIAICRKEHVPVLIHVIEMTQPQGHSTSGSHERYKSKDRLAWEEEHDCLLQMRKWMIVSAISTDAEMDELEATAKKYVRDIQRQVWNELADDVRVELNEAARLIDKLAEHSTAQEELTKIVAELRECVDPGRKDVVGAIRKSLRLTVRDNSLQKQQLINWLADEQQKNSVRYNSRLV